MAKIRHIALAAKDPLATAAFYIKAFDFKEVQRFGDFTGGTEGKSYGVYLSDGTLNLAIIHFGWPQPGRDLGFLGLHHFGVEVNDADAYTQKLESLGAECFVRRPEGDSDAFYEVKFVGPDTVLFDIAEKPWVGTEPAAAAKQGATEGV